VTIVRVGVVPSAVGRTVHLGPIVLQSDFALLASSARRSDAAPWQDFLDGAVTLPDRIQDDIQGCTVRDNAQAL